VVRLNSGIVASRNRPNHGRISRTANPVAKSRAARRRLGVIGPPVGEAAPGSQPSQDGRRSSTKQLYT